jgi:hypothetical protein
MEDKLVKCSHCESEMCYATQINETSWAYNCPSCGFTANDFIKDGEYDVEKFEEMMPELYKDLKSIDNEGKVWYPIVVENEEGIVFIDGATKDNWTWSAIKNRSLTEEEKKIYVEQGKEIPKHKSDTTTKRNFGRVGFLEAISYINGI